MNSDAAWEAIKQQILCGSATQVAALLSPEGEPLLVRYTPGGRAAISIKCKKGWPRIQLDGLASEPPWVNEIGLAFETAPKA